MWKAYLIETMTGRLGAEIEMSTNGRYDIRLNQTEQATVTVQKSSLAGIQRRWMTPWRAGILVTFTTPDEREHPVLAGPITSPPDEYPESLSFSVSGIRRILEHRFLLDQDYASMTNLDAASRMDRLKRSSVTYKQKPLDFIAQDIVRKGMVKTGGSLPIVYALPGEFSPSLHDRTYLGYDLANNDIDKLLSQISDTLQGPDIMFRPEWANSGHSAIQWRMHTGGITTPAIPQGWTMSVDATAPEPQVSEFSINTDGDHFATRAYATGAGDGAELALAASDATALLEDYFPLLEAVVPQASVKEPSTLLGYAQAATNTRALVEQHLTIDAADERSEMGRWFVGDKAQVTVNGWLSIPDATQELRIFRMQGDFDSTHTTIYLQEDEW